MDNWYKQKIMLTQRLGSNFNFAIDITGNRVLSGQSCTEIGFVAAYLLAY